MDTLDALLERAWQVRLQHFPPILGVDIARRTLSVSLTGESCALDCAHCGRHYLKAMVPVQDLRPGDPRLADAHSLLISGGCDARGRVPVRAHLDRVRELRQGRRLNWHVGLVEQNDLRAMRDLADVVSFDVVGDNATIAEVYGSVATVEDYRATYALLRSLVEVIPHITIGLRGGVLSGERAALDLLAAEGASAIVFLVFIPTRGTRYADRDAPRLEHVVGLLAEARLRFPDIPLVLGCLRPAGAYRRTLDALAVRAGINRIVKPDPAAMALAAQLGLELERTEECCALAVKDTRVCPQQLRVSAGTEVVLGLRQRPVEAPASTAYLMLEGDGCSMACAFCAQARGSHARPDALSRVVWPAHPAEVVLTRLGQAPNPVERVCVQVTVHNGAVGEVSALVRALRRHTSHPISVSIRPPDLNSVERLFVAGVDAIGLGLDAANGRVYRQVKGAGWKRWFDLVQAACRAFPRRVRVHLIVGLGETEREICHCIQQVHDWGGSVGLFAFTPVRGTRLENRPPPPVHVYRRVQVARYLIEGEWADVGQFSFDEQGCLTAPGYTELRELLSGGEAFRTSGCPGCNRPFYNERPGGIPYNYPRPLSREEADRAIAQTGLAGLG